MRLRLSEVKAYLRAVKAKKEIENARIGLIGYADMGLFTVPMTRRWYLTSWAST